MKTDVVTLYRKRVEKRLADLEARKNSDIVMSKVEWNQINYCIALCKNALGIGQRIEEQIAVAKAAKEARRGKVTIH